MSRAPRFVAAMVAVCALAAALAAVAGAAPGDTDRSFGKEGFVNLDREASARAYGEDMAVGAGGALYVLRSAQDCSSFSCLVEHRVDRFLSNGAPDASFGVRGTSTALAAAGGASAGLDASLGLGADGRAVVAWIESGKLVLQRLNPDGTLDGSFGSAGKVKFDFGFPISRARIAVQSDGKVVVAAEPETGYAGDAVVVTRFTAQGASDPSFDGGAPVSTSLGSGLGGLARTATGGVLLAGPRCCSSAGRAVHLARLDAAGAFDSGSATVARSSSTTSPTPSRWVL